MARIAGVDLPREKKVEIGLTYIFGIGRATARRILASTGVNAEQRIRDLNDTDVNRLRQAIEKDFRVEHQATNGHRKLPGYSSSPRTSRSWSAHAHQRPHQEGPTPRNRRQEEG